MLTSKVTQKLMVKELVFPCLLRREGADRNSTIIVLALKLSKADGCFNGTVVAIETKRSDFDSLGDYSHLWPLEEFKPFYGTVFIENVRD